MADTTLPRGWYQVAFERDVTAPLTPAAIGPQPIVLVREDGAIRAFDAICPHRGAHLARGGRLVKGAIVCGFHQYRICLGADGDQGLAVAEYDTLVEGGMVSVRLRPGADHGWPALARALARDCTIVNGFELRVAAPMETVIENAFDQRHFRAVHGIVTEPFDVTEGPDGELVVGSRFLVPTPGRDGRVTPSPVPYRAVVPSPGIAVVELNGEFPYIVITGATDAGDGQAVIRLSIAFPKQNYPDGPRPEMTESLLSHSRRGLEEDRVFWESLVPLAAPAWTPEDDGSRRFLAFCDAHRNG